MIKNTHNIEKNGDVLTIEIKERPAVCFAWRSPEGVVTNHIDSTIALTRLDLSISDDILYEAEAAMKIAIAELHTDEQGTFALLEGKGSAHQNYNDSPDWSVYQRFTTFEETLSAMEARTEHTDDSILIYTVGELIDGEWIDMWPDEDADQKPNVVEDPV